MERPMHNWDEDKPFRYDVFGDIEIKVNISENSSKQLILYNLQ